MVAAAASDLMLSRPECRNRTGLNLALTALLQNQFKCEASRMYVRFSNGSK
jgi:hypothetical protein